MKSLSAPRSTLDAGDATVPVSAIVKADQYYEFGRWGVALLDLVVDRFPGPTGNSVATLLGEMIYAAYARPPAQAVATFNQLSVHFTTLQRPPISDWLIMLPATPYFDERSHEDADAMAEYASLATTLSSFKHISDIEIAPPREIILKAPIDLRARAVGLATTMQPFPKAVAGAIETLRGKLNEYLLGGTIRNDDFRHAAPILASLFAGEFAWGRSVSTQFLAKGIRGGAVREYGDFLGAVIDAAG